jgi:hypothetical protein
MSRGGTILKAAYMEYEVTLSASGILVRMGCSARHGPRASFAKTGD